MPKRVSDESRIVEFFSTASVDKTQTVYNIVSGIVKGRLGGTRASSTSKKRTTKGVERPEIPETATVSTAS